MANVSGGNSTSRVKVSNTKAEYYSYLTEKYTEQTKEYMETCEINVQKSQTQYDKISAILADLPTQMQANLTEIINTGDDKIEDINEACEGLINEAKDWANKTDGTVDDEEYSAKYYAQLTANEYSQALNDISAELSNAKAEITSEKEQSVNEITGTKTSSIEEISNTGAATVSNIETVKNSSISSINSLKEQSINDITTLKESSETSLQQQFNTYSSTMDNKMDAFIKNYDRLYKGVNLEEKFALEIALYDSKYAWLENRKNTGDFTGIHVGDYFYTTMKAGTVAGYTIAAQTFTCRIVGINTYYGCADTNIGNMLYIHTDEVIDTPIKWNPTDNNNGTSNRNNPWLASAMYAILNGENNYDATSGYNKVAHGANASSCGIINLLESELVAVLKQKRNILDSRYSSSGLLTGGTAWIWADMGKLYLPNEIEVYGCGIRSDRCLTSGFWFPESELSIQFPWYANNCGNRVKRNSSGSRCNWWLSSVASNNTAYVCYVSYSGLANSSSATSAAFCAPLCFCI